MLSRYSDPHSLPCAASAPLLGGPTFALRHRLMRLVWSAAWLLLAAWTPSFMWRWRGLILRAFGAQIHKTAIVRGSARIWWPAHLSMGAHSSLGPDAICYNVAPVSLADFAIVSQRAHLCTGTHDINHPNFPLKTRPIFVGMHGWVAAEAFVGPGVTMGEGAVLGARAVASKDLDAWTVYAGNPARAVKTRRLISRTAV
ncbi:putative colanic acid biosynthesis acetyltransferase [Phyllobacterium salinisoli]|uniref:Putative colanic acid biosynthesis acetyltransferase n=1 Tax=Phyllobacterium salinisoli TaxID=1899321 RepID=A0A368JZU1_9HYPH|nr:putative colanic acid biosynthesis acetyltransferase [Phyllobacterium salinisoli]RCS22658.1 putative colanic acid biosynthesis acetyltransferase [Phyllobacterium salinisoli]